MQEFKCNCGNKYFVMEKVVVLRDPPQRPSKNIELFHAEVITTYRCTFCKQEVLEKVGY